MLKKDFIFLVWLTLRPQDHRGQTTTPTFHSEMLKHLDGTCKEGGTTQFCNMSALVQSLPMT